MPGLERAVHVDGTINDNKDRDRGWTVELRMDFSRFNQYKEAPPAKDPGGWAWSPHGVSTNRWRPGTSSGTRTIRSGDAAT
jgi:hypothetical protein